MVATAFVQTNHAMYRNGKRETLRQNQKEDARWKHQERFLEQNDLYNYIGTGVKRGTFIANEQFKQTLFDNSLHKTD